MTNAIFFIFDRYRDRDRRRSQPLWPSSTARTGAVCTTATQAILAAVVASAPPPERASPPSPLLGGGREEGGTAAAHCLEQPRDVGHQAHAAIEEEALRRRGRAILVGWGVLGEA